MSTATYTANAVPSHPAPSASSSETPLADVVDFAASGVRTPAQEKQLAEWMSRLKGQPPRQNVHCLSWSTRFGKRILDVVIAASLLVLLSPVMLLTAIAVKLTSPGPVIFRQTRVGLNLRKDRNDRRRNDYGPPKIWENVVGPARIVASKPVTAESSRFTNSARCEMTPRKTGLNLPSKGIRG